MKSSPHISSIIRNHLLIHDPLVISSSCPLSFDGQRSASSPSVHSPYFQPVLKFKSWSVKCSEVGGEIAENAELCQETQEQQHVFIQPSEDNVLLLSR